MILIEITRIGDPDGIHHVDNGLPPFLADVEYTAYDNDRWYNIRKMQFLFNEDISSLDNKLHRFASYYLVACFPQYNEVIVRYKRKKNA